jgi:hypothetical protein
MERGLLPCEVILPKSALFCVVFGLANRTRFGAFDAEARISILTLSVMLKIFRSAISSFTVHGLRRYDIWRGVSPYVMLAGKANAAGLRYGILPSAAVPILSWLQVQAGLISGI